MRRALWFTLPILLLLNLGPVLRAEPFELRDGDRVVLLGDTLIEREQYHGWIELALTTRFPDRHVTFRNLGWSADTPAGESRCGLSLLQAGLEPPEEGWRMLKEQLRQTKPTVVILGYGMASSFAGEAGLPKFRADMERLLDTIQEQAAETKVRVVILSPIRHLAGKSPLPTPEAHNKELARYTASLGELATKREALFISLFDGLSQNEEKVALSDNGIHPNAAGYRAVAQLIERGLGWPASAGRDDTAIERLRQVILKKNELYFHRSRPANMAYIFGFRKAEQGRNAVEIPQFDALIEAEEKKIALLRSLQPVKLPDEPAPRTQAAAAKFTPQPRPTFEVAPELEVTLWAENPLLHKPIQMNFDPQGRLWVASSEVYPQVEPGQTANDKIIVLQDTDGDGKADKSSVFAEGLLIPTGLEPGDGGVYVAQSTELLHFTDTDGDGKADKRRIVLSGFGTEDTHHNLHTLRRGHDGRLYMNQSIYTRTDTETPSGVVRLKSGGVLRLDTKSMAMDIFVRGFWNSWGHQFDAFGQSFLTDGAGDSGINYGLPGATYVGAARPRRLLDGISPGKYPKFCSLEIIHSQHFPPDWQGDMIACDFRANRVVRFRVTEEGAGYVAQDLGSILRSKEVTFRPIDVKLGPDGTLYIADWSNPIINHGEVDFRDPRRDREHGRIWRVSVKNRPTNASPQLAKATNAALLETLRSPNAFDQAQARRVLHERGQAVLVDLKAWTAKQTDEPALLQALWMKQTLGDVDPVLLGRLLKAQDGRVRAAAVRVLGSWLADRSTELGPLLTSLIQDQHPRVRLEAVRTLAGLHSAGAALTALKVLDQPMDRFLEYALWLTMNDLAEPWLAAVADGTIKTDGTEKGLLFGLSAVPPERASQAIARLLEKQLLRRDGRGPWIELIGQGGGPNELRKLFDQAAGGELDAGATSRALAALGEAARLRRVRPAGDLQPLGKLLDANDAQVRSAAIRLVGLWRLENLVPRIVAFAADRSAHQAVRGVACDALRELKGPSAITTLRSVATNGQEPVALRRQALIALGTVDPEGALPVARETINEAEGPDADELWRSLLGLTGMSKRLADNIRATPLKRGVAVAGLKVARDSAETNPDLVKLLANQGEVPEPRVWTAAEFQQLAAQARLKGDAARGELVYRRADLKCITCHAIGGAGGKVGPDLTSIGAAAPLDYLVESILAPTRKVKEGYHAIVLLTADGRTLTGIPVRETDKEVILRDAEDKEIAIARADIEQRANTGSLMPVSLVDATSEQDRLDLFRFLGELGRPGPFDVTKSQSPRVWRVLDLGKLSAEQAKKAQLGDSTLQGWISLTTTLSGGLLRSELQALFTGGTSPEKVLAATRFDMPRAGKATLHVESQRPLVIWLDGKEYQLDGEKQLDLTAGPHTLVVNLDLAGLPERFVLKSAEVVFVATP